MSNSFVSSYENLKINKINFLGQTEGIGKPESRTEGI